MMCIKKTFLFSKEKLTKEKRSQNSKITKKSNEILKSENSLIAQTVQIS